MSKCLGLQKAFFTVAALLGTLNHAKAHYTSFSYSFSSSFSYSFEFTPIDSEAIATISDAFSEYVPRHARIISVILCLNLTLLVDALFQTRAGVSEKAFRALILETAARHPDAGQEERNLLDGVFIWANNAMEDFKLAQHLFEFTDWTQTQSDSAERFKYIVDHLDSARFEMKAADQFFAKNRDAFHVFDEDFATAAELHFSVAISQLGLILELIDGSQLSQP